MIGLPWVLLALSVISFCLFFVFSMRAVRRLRYLEDLFYDSLEDIQNAANIFDTLVNRRQLLSNDPDVKQVKQVFGVTLDVLGEFIVDGKKIATKQKERKEIE